MPANTEYSVFVPIRHSHLVSYYRVPIWVHRNDGEVVKYVVSVGDDSIRMFNNNTAPQEMKAVIAMIDAFPWEKRFDISRGKEQWAYECPDPKQMEVGWRVSDELYMTVLPVELLDDIYMKGKNG